MLINQNKMYELVIFIKLDQKINFINIIYLSPLFLLK